MNKCVEKYGRGLVADIWSMIVPYIGARKLCTLRSINNAIKDIIDTDINDRPDQRIYLFGRDPMCPGEIVFMYYSVNDNRRVPCTRLKLNHPYHSLVMDGSTVELHDKVALLYDPIHDSWTNNNPDTSNVSPDRYKLIAFNHTGCHVMFPCVQMHASIWKNMPITRRNESYHICQTALSHQGNWYSYDGCGVILKYKAVLHSYQSEHWRHYYTINTSRDNYETILVMDDTPIILSLSYQPNLTLSIDQIERVKGESFNRSITFTYSVIGTVRVSRSYNQVCYAYGNIYIYSNNGCLIECSVHLPRIRSSNHRGKVRLIACPDNVYSIASITVPKAELNHGTVTSG